MGIYQLNYTIYQRDIRKRLVKSTDVFIVNTKGKRVQPKSLLPLVLMNAGFLESSSK